MSSAEMVLLALKYEKYGGTYCIYRGIVFQGVRWLCTHTSSCLSERTKSEFSTIAS
jgi:hypothetical protein